MALFSRPTKKHGMAGMLEERADRIERTGRHLSRSTAETGADVSRKVSDILRRAANDISTIPSGSARAKVVDTFESARGIIDDNAVVVKTNIREHPFASVAMAVGMGFVAGAVISFFGSRMVQESRY